MKKFIINLICTVIPLKKQRKAFRSFLTKYLHRTPDLYNRCIPKRGIFYKGRTEVGAINLSDKLNRVKAGGPFELPDMIATNIAILDLLEPQDQNIVNLGAGTGTFEHLGSKRFPKRRFVASEFDHDCIAWCKEKRQKCNIDFTSLSTDRLKIVYGHFDCAVSADVIEHITDFPSFLRSLTQLAPKAIISTPNKDRTIEDATAPIPAYYQHTQEWDAGEFHWILKCFYKEVKLYSITSYEERENLKMSVEISEVGLLSTYPKLIAVCKNAMPIAHL